MVFYISTKFHTNNRGVIIVIILFNYIKLYRFRLYRYIITYFASGKIINNMFKYSNLIINNEYHTSNNIKIHVSYVINVIKI